MCIVTQRVSRFYIFPPGHCSICLFRSSNDADRTSNHGSHRCQTIYCGCGGVMRSPISSYPLRFMASGFIRAPHYPLAIHLPSHTVPPHNTHPPLHARPSRIHLLLLTNTCALLWYTKWCRRSRLVRRILVDSILSHSSAYILGRLRTSLLALGHSLRAPKSPGILTVE